jgi:hypothetical protein
VQLDDAVKSASGASKDSKKKLNALNAKALNAMKQKLKRWSKGDGVEAEMDEFRAVCAFDLMGDRIRYKRKTVSQRKKSLSSRRKRSSLLPQSSRLNRRMTMTLWLLERAARLRCRLSK